MTVYDTAKLLPSISVLRDHCRALATLEAIIRADDPFFRRYAFDGRWSATEELATMSTGWGDEFSIVFSPAGAWIRGFDHFSPMSPYVDDMPWPGVVDEVPEVFRRYVKKPAFSDPDGFPVVTACLWRTADDETWRTGTIDFPENDNDGEDPDGAAYLFQHLTNRSAEAYQKFAVERHQVPVDLAAVRHVLALRPLTAEVVTALRPDRTLADLADDLATIGYPHAGH
ncbi:hypothetical protein [Streptomyces sp. NPDC003036]|uniref:hypothetical protein n=1 Tax=Streptomyces sp. NPDC003036 TaxID=3154442 RepID=UPI0033B0D124